MDHDRRSIVMLGVAVVGFFALMLFAIKINDDSAAGSGSGGLEETLWTVESMAFEGASFVPRDGSPITAIFADGHADGSGGCNTYSGPYQIDGSGIAVGPLASTRALCGNPLIDEAEGVYFALLDSAIAFSVDGNRLVIASAAEGEIVYSSG